MGDINFNITKDVDLNKVVNLDVDKNVDVNVNVDDLLATAEADAEVFGEYGLAEVDAYTYVSEGEGDVVVESSGFIDAVGNAPDLVVGDPTGLFPSTITQIFTDGADIDDLNAPGEDNHLNHFDDALGGIADNPLPQDVFAPQNDKVLELVGPVDDLTNEAFYRLTEDWTVVLTPPTDLDMDGDGLTGAGNLTMVIPEGTIYQAEFPGDDSIEFEFFEFPEDRQGVFLYNDTLANEFVIEQFNYVQEGETLGEGISDWALQAAYDFSMRIGNGGEAFAYAESSSAVDLNGDGDVIPVIETEI